jgi:hypothetical protein
MVVVVVVVVMLLVMLLLLVVGYRVWGRDGWLMLYNKV